jgi:hypothetical protein
MGLKDVGKRLGNIAFRLLVCDYCCGGECGRCKNSENQPTSTPQGEEPQKPVK